MHLFYDPNINGEYHVFSEEESRHISKVLRLGKSDILFVTDGIGNLFKAEIAELHQKKTLVKILKINKEYGKRDYYLHIAIAPTKNIDRYEYFIEKSTEIGIDEITPIICKNSERKIVKTDRLKRIAEAAIKQSQKAYLPKINEQIIFDKFISSTDNYCQKLIAHCDENSEKKYLGNIIDKKQKVLILIGPEGDFNKNEIDLARKAGFAEISLGNSRLRTETAGLVSCAIVNFKNEM